MASLPWISYLERVVGRNHPTLTDVANRPLRQLLSESGYDPDASPFPGLMGPVFNVKAFGAVVDDATDDTVGVQAALAAAFNFPGGTVVIPGKCRVTNLTLPDVAGTIRIVGVGRPRGFSGGVASDPVAIQGSSLTQLASATGDLFSSVLTGSKRQYITIENLYLEGNPAASSGHVLHFQTSSTTCGILVCLRDVTVANAKQHGIFFDGNVFESTWYNVRVYQCGDRGFKAAANGGGLPGEVRIYGATINANAYGVDISDGGIFSFHGLSLNGNTNEGLLADGVQLFAFDLNLEQNGPLAGNEATITSCGGAQLNGVVINTKIGGTGNGLSFVTCGWVSIRKLGANSSVAGGGYMDIRFDNGSSRCTVEDYSADDFVERIALGTGGGHSVHRGRSWQSGQSHAVTVASVSTSVGVTPDAVLADKFEVTCTGAGGITITINNPVIATAGNYHDGQIFTVEIFNNTAGTVATNWQGLWHLAGAWVAPASGKTRLIQFSWNFARGGFFEIARSAADIT